MTNERTADVFVIGAADGVGRRLATLLTSCGDHVTGMHRKPEQVVVITITGATSAPGDLVADSVHELAAQVRATTRSSSPPAPTAPAWTRRP